VKNTEGKSENLPPEVPLIQPDQPITMPIDPPNIPAPVKQLKIPPEVPVKNTEGESENSN